MMSLDSDTQDDCRTNSRPDNPPPPPSDPDKNPKFGTKGLSWMIVSSLAVIAIIGVMYYIGVVRDKYTKVRDLSSQAMTAMSKGDMANARKCLEDVLKIDPDNISAKEKLAEIDFLEDARTKSRELYNQAMIAISNCDKNTARICLESALKIDPDNALAKEKLAKIDTLIDARFKARDLYNQAMTAMSNGDMVTSRKCLEDAVKIDPDYESAKEALRNCIADAVTKELDKQAKQVSEQIKRDGLMSTFKTITGVGNSPPPQPVIAPATRPVTTNPTSVSQ
jgi:Tfp pilus assembly protein PilF